LKQTLPWDLPNSIRPLDVTHAVGSTSTMLFANLDPSNQPATVTNDLTNFGWEYVWHCHILGHEENDMMRPMVFAVNPIAPTGLTAVAGAGTITFHWTDNSLNETGFTIQSATAAGGPWTNVYTVVGTAGTGARSYVASPPPPTGLFYYRVIANNVVGYISVFAYPTVSADSTASNVAGPVAR
jgi:hypothetical protein